MTKIAIPPAGSTSGEFCRSEGDLLAVRGGDHLDVVPGERARPQHDPACRTGQVADDDVGVLDELLAVGELADAAGGAGEHDAAAVR